jgi:ATP adenylyltransferase
MNNNDIERQNLWAPWRMEYIQRLSGDDEQCFLCRYYGEPDKDKENLVLFRSTHCFVTFNRFPYNNGHLLIAPNEHIGDMDSFSDECLLDMAKTVRKCKQMLSEAIKPHGFNVGVNIGRCAGAGLPGHLHYHIVPRWNGDTNFMAVCGQTDVVSQSMEALYAKLKPLC